MNSENPKRGIFSRLKDLEQQAPLTGFLRECAACAISEKKRGEDKFDVAVATIPLGIATLGLDALDAVARYVGKKLDI